MKELKGIGTEGKHNQNEKNTEKVARTADSSQRSRAGTYWK